MKLAILLLLSSLSLAQQSATTSAPCSPITPDNTGTITINCPGMSKEQWQKMLAILNKIRTNQLDPEVVMSKLDEIINGVNELKRASKDRHLTDEQKTALIAALTPFKSSTVSIETPMGNPEAYSFAEDFAAVFRSAGLTLAAWTLGADKTGVNEINRAGGAPVSGIDIEPKDQKEWETPLVQSFVDALDRKGIPHTQHYGNYPTFFSGPIQLRLWIGLKSQN